ncbi:signal peptide protein [Rhodopirellula europaea 6C]|uniref:Signal peptide protein n=2 Tax=Rhodopirellula TaxID=265488 RepID=M2AM96_9BACT|nr:signal peptide protein [Rhodopirellula europaea 6C]
MLAYLDTHLNGDEPQSSAIKAGAVADDVGWTAMGSRYHCALLCTWVI